MDQEDSMLKLSTFLNEFDEQSINFVLENLNSKSNQIVYDSIIQIKNLIIGNNKYKTFYLKEKLLNRLMELINDYYVNYLLTLINDNNSQNTKILMDNQIIDLINQLLIIFGSFSLGNLNHISELIKKFNLHTLLFNLIRLNRIYIDLNPSCLKENLNLKLIDSCLRALSNLYSSSQILPALVYQLDKQLYFRENDEDSIPTNLDCLIKLFTLSNTTKQSVLNIITISAQNLMISNTIKSNKPSQNEYNSKNRSFLIKSDLIRLFSGLLTSLQQKMQLNCLKFYSAICFESLESTRLVLATSFYDYSLLDLISSYLSRENSPELQLYSAKCLTNMSRSSLIFKSNGMDLDLNEFKLISFNSNLIKFKVLTTLIRLCSTYSSLYRNKTNDLNSLLLIETLSTLSYLIELSSDLQRTAACLEQVIHIIVSNILNGYLYLKKKPSSLCLNKTCSYSLNKQSCTSLFSLFYLYYYQFTAKYVYYKLNEHQYKILNSLYLSEKNDAKNFEFNLNKCLITVCFQTLACLGSNNEESRRVISENSELLNCLIESIELNESESNSELSDDLEELISYKESDNSNQEYTSSDATLLRISSLCLLHSLSRSVHQLRTRFLDSKLWNSLIELIKRLKLKKTSRNQNKKMETKLMNISNFDLNEKKNLLSEKLMNDQDLEEDNNNQIFDESSTIECVFLNDKEDDLSLNEKNLISILLAVVANLLIEFSPCKETLINDDIIKILIDFIDYKNKSIRINSIWALMNLAYHSEQKIKQQILAELTVDKLFQLLTEQDELLVIKTLGLIRNLICNRVHIDHLMCFYGTKIIQAIIMVLEGEYYNKMVKEQALCILANIADGVTSKEFIMANEDLLRKINSFMTNSHTELQVAAVCCVCNLVLASDDGAVDRQLKLKDIGAHKILQKLLHSNDPILFEKVKATLQQFSTSNNNNSQSNNSNSVLST